MVGIVETATSRNSLTAIDLMCEDDEEYEDNERNISFVPIR